MNGAANDRTPEEVRFEIEQTRTELGDTVEALVAKTDVKAQAKQAVANAKTTVADKTADVKQTITNRTSDIRETLTDKQDEVAVAAQDSAPSGVADAGRRARTLAEANRPALVAAATFALGLLIGSRRGR